MPKLLLALVLGSCLYLANAESLKYKEGYFYEHRERLGHFSDAPLTDLYKSYAVAFVAPKNPGRAHDDFRNYVPSAEECVSFLRSFSAKNYVLTDLDQFVILDACLGYLYQSEDQEEDLEQNPSLKDPIESYKKTPELYDLYHNTKFADFPLEARECVGNLFFDVIRVKSEFPDVTCNNHWLQVFISFAQCYDKIPSQATVSDSYIKTLLPLLRDRAQECFHTEIMHINQAARARYVGKGSELLKRGVFWKDLQKQANERIWVSEIVKILAAAQDTDKQINIREVHNIVKGVVEEDPDWKNRLTVNMAKFANKAVDTTDKKANAKDPSGDERYKLSVDRLCRFFRTSDSERNYDFVTPFTRLVKLTDYDLLFGVTKRDFIKAVFGKAWESAPVYLGVSVCNILSFTEGFFEQDVRNKRPSYVVVFKTNLENMVRWPTAPYY